MNTVDIPGEWEQSADQIKQDAKTCIVTCIIIGKNDSGKSTFCKYLVHTWTASEIRVGYVDSDVGQSTIGPPTTVGLKIFNTPPNQHDYSNFLELHFVGNTSPEGFLLQTLHAVKRMADKSHQQGSQITLVDTTGFVGGPVARIFKLHKIEMLRPQWIVALQAEDEMEHLLRGYEKMGWRVIRLTCSKQVAARSQAERQKYRNERYKAYFKSAKVINCPIHKVVFPSCILGTGQRINPLGLPKETYMSDTKYLYIEKCGSELLIVIDRLVESMPFYKLKEYFSVTSIACIERFELKDLLVGLNDKDGNTLGLGTIIDLDPLDDKLTLFTPVQDIHKVTAIYLGNIKVEQGEKECGKMRHVRYL
ncbi:MAG TPA: Clp1/GlmU family protein [Candidatus Wunengus sp. YC61]|uniref:Clp1/GlmU family protein n=1 Tax=Candidatus Wunengus sp. YC61 TaxID=3367698 RepID=UPI004028D9B3